MQATHLDAFLASAFEVLGQLAQAKPHRGSPVLRLGATLSSRELTSLVIIEGDLVGVVFYSMSLATAAKLGLSPSPAATDEQTRPPHEVILHTTRAIAAGGAGRLAELGCRIETSDPRLIIGFGAPVTAASPVLTVPLFTQYGDMDIGMAMQPAGEREAGALPLRPQPAPGDADLDAQSEEVAA